MGPPSILVILLTSAGLNYLKEAVNSILHQKDTHIDYTVVIIVNTLSDEYYKEVLSYFTLIKVVRTLSNGRPGKGHNSVLDYFKNNPQFDYIIPIDGDDFLYPYALTYIEQYITASTPADILMLMYTDIIHQHTKFIKKNSPVIRINNQGYLSWNMYNKNARSQILDGWYKERARSPFIYDVSELQTPCRVVLLSRAAIQNDLYYNEDCVAFDDFIAIMKIYELIYTSTLHIMQTDYSGIILYNRLDHDSVCHKFTNRLHAGENNLFKEIIANKFIHIRQWDLTSIPYINMPEPVDFTFKTRYEFVKALFSNLQIKQIDFSKQEHIAIYQAYLQITCWTKNYDTDKTIFDIYINDLYDFHNPLIEQLENR
jgi:hypothetical protein